MGVEIREGQSNQAERAWATKLRLRGRKRKNELEKEPAEPPKEWRPGRFLFHSGGGPEGERDSSGLSLNPGQAPLPWAGSECHVVFISGLRIATPPCRTWPDRRWGQAQTESAWAGELGWGLLELPAVRSEAHTGPSGYFFQLALAQETPAWRSPDRSMSLPLAGS